MAKAAAERMVPATLELGGKSANIVFPDANMENAVKGACAGIFAATGQTCIAGSRLLLHRSIADSFLKDFLTLAQSAHIGDPMELTTQVGPVTTWQQFDRILGFIDRAQQQGARVVFGGTPAKVANGEGWFIEPTIFTDVTPEMEIAQKEVFGPVLSVMLFDDEEEALAVANGTDYGLAAGI